MRFVSLLILLLLGCGRPAGPYVVLYTSVDEPFARPVLRAFTEKTGIEVRAVFDTEAAKTVGLARRIVAEAGSPRCDVFWSNELLQTLLLSRDGLLVPYLSPEAGAVHAEFRPPAGHWTGMGGRLRVLLARPGTAPLPDSVDDLADPAYAGAAAMAQPIAGTTLTHAAAIVAVLGVERARSFFEAAIRNRVKVVAGNATAKDLVVEGEASWCLTDTDDALKGVEEDPALAIIVPDQGTEGSGAFLIPGSVALIAGAPHEAVARQLIDFLLSRETTEAMLRDGAFQVPLRADCTAPRPEFRHPPVRYRDVDWEAVLRRLEETQRLMTDLFVR